MELLEFSRDHSDSDKYDLPEPFSPARLQPLLSVPEPPEETQHAHAESRSEIGPYQQAWAESGDEATSLGGAEAIDEVDVGKISLIESGKKIDSL
jgi:hypothetical protein